MLYVVARTTTITAHTHTHTHLLGMTVIGRPTDTAHRSRRRFATRRTMATLRQIRNDIHGVMKCIDNASCSERERESQQGDGLFSRSTSKNVPSCKRRGGSIQKSPEVGIREIPYYFCWKLGLDSRIKRARVHSGDPKIPKRWRTLTHTHTSPSPHLLLSHQRNLPLTD